MSAELITTPITPDLLRGCLETERTPDGLLPHRLPEWARAQTQDPQLHMVESQPSGVRLALRTAATHVELTAVATTRVYIGVPARPGGLYDLVVDGRLVGQGTVGEGRTMTIDMMTGSSETTFGPAGTVVFTGLAPGEKDVEIWLPHDQMTELVELRTDAPVAPAPPSLRRTWLHHGSSISHGSIAASPSRTWPALAAAHGDVELVNLGFGGSALLDPFTARAMRDTPADLVSVKVGINLVNLDLMRLRAFVPAVHGFLDTIREGHPDAPLLVVSPILCPIHEETPGPGAPDAEALAEGRLVFRAMGDPDEVPAGKLTLQVIRRELAAIVEQRQHSDPHLHHLDGLHLYGRDDFDVRPLPDALHPVAETHEEMARRFAATVFSDGGPFGPR